MSLLLTTLALALAKQQAPQITPLKPSSIYRQGERVGWHVSGGAPGTYKYVLRRDNKVEVSHGSFEGGRDDIPDLVTKPGKPCMYYLEVTTPGGKKLAFGAAYEPTKINPSEPRPADFKSFWADKVAKLRLIPENAVVTPKPTDQKDIDFGTVTMDITGGEKVYGQFARPKKKGKHPALLMLQWASPPYPLDKWWIIPYAKQGFIALDIEPHNVPPDASPAFYQGLPQQIKNYTSIGQSDREKNYFLAMYLRGVRALDWLAKDPEWDGKTLLVIGTSMGGQQSLCLAGLHSKVTHLIVNVPAGCDINADLHGRQGGYPNFNVKDPLVAKTGPYFDAVNFAPDIKATCLVAMGFIDVTSPPTGIWAAFNQIKGPKEAAPMPESPHNHLATPAQLKPYTERSAAWLDELARTGKVSLGARRS